jgi:sulfide dehydrogenase cytochrome subunit
MSRSKLCVIATAALLASCAPGRAAEKSEWLANACMSCHGLDGVSRGAIPSLVGRSAADLTQAMKAFASGAQRGTVMNFLAKGYTDDQLATLATYFSNRKAP